MTADEMALPACILAASHWARAPQTRHLPTTRTAPRAWDEHGDPSDRCTLAMDQVYLQSNSTPKTKKTDSSLVLSDGTHIRTQAWDGRIK